MLYDPAPLNNPNDPGHDMSKYVGLLAEGTFQYRRSLVEIDNTGSMGKRWTTVAAADAGGGVEDEGEETDFDFAAATHGARRLASAADSEWRKRMVFYEGDERATFFNPLEVSPTPCDPTSAIFDPACRTPRKTHKEVAYNGYGVYRGGCTLSPKFNAWVCPGGVTSRFKPARLVIESMDKDHTARSLTPLALASGGYVDLINGGWDHQSPKACGGYSCLQRLMTFHTTVAVNRSYDLAFTATNPRHLRLMMPYGGGEAAGTPISNSRFIISIFYSNPEKLTVTFNGKAVPPLPVANAKTFNMQMPTLSSPCGTNAYAPWTSKLTVLVCGGLPGVEIRTVPKIVLSLGLELKTEDFFDQHFLTRNLASLFGIPASRMRVPKIVAGSTRRRRLADGAAVTDYVVDIEIIAEDLCAKVPTCGPHGTCYEGDCTCSDGWETPFGCDGGSCLCSKRSGCQVGCASCDAAGDCLSCTDAAPFMRPPASRTTSPSTAPVLPRCLAECPPRHGVLVITSGDGTDYAQCRPCHESCGGSCVGPAPTQCTACDPVGLNSHLLNGRCISQCPRSFYADEHHVCHRCHDRCNSCSGPRATDCLGCKPNKCSKRGRCPEGVVFPILDGGQCLSNCPHGRYAGTSAVSGAPAAEEAVCLPCNPACQRCSGPNSTQCVDPTPRSPFIDDDCATGARRRGGSTTCVAVCASSFHVIPQTPSYCGACASYDCAECDPSLPSKCLACRPQPWIRPALHDDHQCYEACPEGQYLSTTGRCTVCDATCKSCDSFGPASCSSCHRSSGFPIHHGGSCLTVCPVGLGEDMTANNGTGGACSPCHSSCASCTIAGDKAKCTACAVPKLVVPSVGLGTCSPRCPKGEYVNATAGVCMACASNCAECTSAAQCTLCKVGLKNNGGVCVSSAELTAGRLTNEQQAADLESVTGQIKATSSSGRLDTGYSVKGVAMKAPFIPQTPPPRANMTLQATKEVQRIVIVGNALAAPVYFPPLPPSPHLPPSPPSANPSPPPGATPSPPPPGSPPPMPPSPPPSPDTPLAGSLLVGFNGEVLGNESALDLSRLASYTLGYSGPGFSALDAARMLKVALEQLSTISQVGVTASAHVNASLSPATVSLMFDVHFSYAGDSPAGAAPSPLNLGSLPLIVLDTSDATGLRDARTTVVAAGASPPNMSFPEQAITLPVSRTTLTALEGGMTLSFDGEATRLLPADCSATAMREALMELTTVGEAEVFRKELSDASTGAFSGLEWTVRFYAEGSPAHIGPQPPILVNTSALTVSSSASSRRRLEAISVSVASTVAGTSPFDPADVSDSAAESSITGSDRNSTSSGAEVLTYIAPVHVCGDGVRTSTEVCDDNNTVGGDGCSSSCDAVELGFGCFSSNQADGGTGVGGLDTCFPICGDGRRVIFGSKAEGCDDNNTASGDGCDVFCQVETGYVCSGGSFNDQDTCTAICGDGKRVDSEVCDDSNTVSLDGCSGDCTTIEAGYTCAGGSVLTPDTCASCHPSCATCSGPTTTDCTSCATASPFFNPDQGTCLTTCTPVGKYANASTVCEACDAACGTCSGPSASQCLTCTSSTTPFLSSASCVSECPSGTFIESGGDQAICIACHSSCAECNGGGGSMQCESCPVTGTPYFDGGACVASCASGSYADDDAKQCRACDSDCATCTGGGNTACASCRAGGTFNVVDQTCTYACPVGTYAFELNDCRSCTAQCATCNGGPAVCTSCNRDGLFPLQHDAMGDDGLYDTCLSVCPQGFYADSGFKCARRPPPPTDPGASLNPLEPPTESHDTHINPSS